MGNKTHLGLADVNEVVRDFAQEAAVPAKKAVVEPETDSGFGRLVPAETALDIDLSRLKLGAGEAAKMSEQLSSLTTEQHGDRLQRLERSLMRLERINMQTLAMLQKLVNAVKQPTDENPPR